MSLIYVPQGFSAKMSKQQNDMFVGLYTNNFTTENIAVCVGNNFISLTHIDEFTPLKEFQKMIDSLTNCVLTIYSRDDKEIKKKRLLEYLTTKLPSQKYTLKILEAINGGILVDCTGNIKTIPADKDYENLVFHPKEQIFEDVRKIEKFFQRKKVDSKQRSFYIFDNLFWINFSKCELRVTHKHIKLFSKDELFTGFCKKLVTYISEIEESPFEDLDILRNSIIPVAIALEGYLNNYDYEMLLKRNTLNIFTIALKKEDYSDEDVSFISKMRKNYDDKLIQKYITTAPPSEFRSQFMYEYKLLRRAYREREHYAQLTVKFNEIKTLAINFNSKGVQKYNKGYYTEAEIDFNKAFRHAVIVCDRSEKELSSVLRNLGKNLFKQNKYETAVYFLNVCLGLKVLYSSEEELKPLRDYIDFVKSHLVVE